VQLEGIVLESPHSMWAKATRDTKLSTKDLRQRSEHTRERVREWGWKRSCEAGGFNVPLLLAMKANTQLEVGIGQKTSFLYKWQRAVVCCTSRCSEVTTIVDTYVCWVSSDQYRGRPQREWCVWVIIWMLGTCGVPTLGGDGTKTCVLYQGSEEKKANWSKCYDEGGWMWAWGSRACSACRMCAVDHNT
jgi:hypothetical protein